MTYETIQVRFEKPTCIIKLNRPHANNTINATMIDEFHQALRNLDDSIHIVVLEGLTEVFCFGADFDHLATNKSDGVVEPEALYDLWQQLAMGSFISIAHVKGKANAGGVGFVAACDIVLADHTAEFSLSELLFDLYPACVLPFLVRRIGLQKANYMTLMTKAITTQQALDWGLVDAYDNNSDALLRKHLLRLRHLSSKGIRNYKNYMCKLNDFVSEKKMIAVEANRQLFSDPENLEKINRYTQTGLFPWE